MPIPHGRSAIMATYELPRLSAVLPVEARVPAVIAAADATLRARGYSVSRKSAAEELGEIVAKPARVTNLPTVRIAAHRVFQGTKVIITYEPWGDNASSRSMLDGILQRLDL